MPAFRLLSLLPPRRLGACGAAQKLDILDDALPDSKLAQVDNPDVLQSIIRGLDDEDELLPAALVCKAFYRAVKEGHPDGWSTSPRGIVSSLERFLWVTSLPDCPWWLSGWDETTCAVIARHGGLGETEEQ